MLLVALTCFITEKKQQLFFPKRRKKEKREEKKDMQVQKQWSGGCQGFCKKILPEAKRRCGDFFTKPEGLDLY